MLSITAKVRVFTATILLCASLGSVAAEEEANAAAAEEEAKIDVRPAATGPIEKVSRVFLLATAKAGERVVTVGERGVILYSDDEGGTWKQAEVPVQFTLTSVAFADEKIGWALGHDLLILGTKDGGESWQMQNFMPEEDVPLLSLMVVNAKKVFAVGGRGNLFTTEDGGENWVREVLLTKDELDAHLFSIGESSRGNIFITGEAGNMFISQDQGSSWQQILTPVVPEDELEFGYAEKNEADPDAMPYYGPYVGSYFGTVFHPKGRIIAYAMLGNAFASDDEGKTWKKLKTGQEKSFIDSKVLSDGSILMAGLGGLLVRSHDLGESFEDLSQKDKISIHGITPLGGGKWHFATAAGVKTVDLGFE